MKNEHLAMKCLSQKALITQNTLESVFIPETKTCLCLGSK